MGVLVLPNSVSLSLEEEGLRLLVDRLGIAVEVSKNCEEKRCVSYMKIEEEVPDASREKLESWPAPSPESGVPNVTSDHDQRRRAQTVNESIWWRGRQMLHVPLSPSSVLCPLQKLSRFLVPRAVGLLVRHLQGTLQ